MKIYKTLIRPVVAYGGERWKLAKRTKKHWEVLKERSYMFMAWLKKTMNGVRNNQNVGELLKYEDTVRLVKA